MVFLFVFQLFLEDPRSYDRVHRVEARRITQRGLYSRGDFSISWESLGLRAFAYAVTLATFSPIVAYGYR